MLKPVLNIDEVVAFLSEWAGGEVGGISQFEAGQVSSVFGFEVRGGERSSKYVVRFVSPENGEGLKKDRFIGPRAAAVGLPVPILLKHGEVRMAVGNLSDEEKSKHSADSYPLGFAICDWMPGEHMGEVQDEERWHLIPAQVRGIDLISTIDISDTTGWGWFDGYGNGQHDSWASYISAESFPEGGGDFYERRRDWFDDRGGFLEYDVLRYFSDRMMSMVQHLPEIERSVVHMEFGYDNTLVVGSEVSAALDWDNSIIGDHLYDGAWNDTYASELDYKQLFIDQYARTGRYVADLDNRWLVCQLHVVLQALRWYGLSKKEEAYHWMKGRMYFLLGEGPDSGRHPDSF